MTAYIDNRRARAKLGSVLYRNFQKEDRYQDIDFVSLASELGLTPDELDIEIKTLKIAGYVDHASGVYKFNKQNKRLDGGPFPWEIYKKVFLTDNGILWAAAKFPPIPVPGNNSVSLSVSVHVAISQTITIIQEADGTTEEQRERVELLLRRLESEFGKPSGKGKFSAVKDLLEAAAATKSLLGPVLNFLGEHVHEIEGLSEIL